MNDSVSDVELMMRVARGDRDALTLLFRRRHLDVYRFALQMSGRPPVAEDVVQEVFVAVLADAAKYEAARTNVRAWLCGIARNHVLRHLDAERRLTALDGVDEAEQMPTAEADVLGDLTRAERVEALRRAVLSLPVRYREVLVLCDLQELTYTEAAEAIGCAVGTIRSRLHRARALLSTKMMATESSAEQPAGTRPARCLA